MKNIVNKEAGNEKKVLALIFIIALVLRLIAVMNLPARYQIPACDAAEYDQLAVDLLAGKGLINDATGQPSSWRVPLYPLFLAFIYSIFGHSFVAVRVIQCIMSALLCVFIFHIGKETFDKKIGLFSAAILAFYQPLIFYIHWGGPGFLLSENLFTFLLAIFVFFLIKGLSRQFSLKNSIMSGILLGLLTLTRPVMTLFPIFLFFFFLYKNKYSFISTIKKILPLLISFILVLAPWIVRNYFVHKAFVPFTTEGGCVLLAGNNPYTRGSGIAGDAHVKLLLSEEEQEKHSKVSEIERDKMCRRHAKEYLVKNYKTLPVLFFRKLLTMWDVYATGYEIDGFTMRRKYNLWYSIVLMFSLFGMAKFRKAEFNINSLLLISLLLYHCIIAMIFSGEVRFRSPIEPYLIIFASAGIFRIYNSSTNKFLSSAIIGIIIGINFLCYTYSDSLLNLIRCLL